MKDFHSFTQGDNSSGCTQIILFGGGQKQTGAHQFANTMFKKVLLD